jgi:beta-1,4-mannosyl-glycoprotein beta-1,4-N-acetylglucosaminyltransferase
VKCLKQGTKTIAEEHCVCNNGWFGKTCNIPESIHFSDQLNTKEFLEFRPASARRIIYAAPFNHEFAMLEAVLNDLYDLVDAFIIMESPYTAFGVRKPVRLLPKLYRGYLEKFHSKIMYLYLDHFPLQGRKKGHVADSYLRSYLGKRGMPNIRNVADDDLFLVFDMDEIPSRDSLIFLKAHNRYPEPFGFRFRWSAFGYFWKHRHYSQVPAGCTVGMLRKVYHDDSNLVRDVHHGVTKNKNEEFLEYRQTTLVHSWFIGEVGHFAGWHCSSCFDLEGIRIKFMSAQNADWPRWGSIPTKMELKNIKRMVKDGKWFDGSPLNNRAVSRMADPQKDPFYAPPYIMQNAEKFPHLMKNRYISEDMDEIDIAVNNSGHGLVSLTSTILNYTLILIVRYFF